MSAQTQAAIVTMVAFIVGGGLAALGVWVGRHR